MTSVTKTVKFDAAHILTDHAGLCKNLHGHTYRMEVTVEGEGEMIIDFKELKKIITEKILDRFDHSFLYNVASAGECEIAAVVEKLSMRTVPLPFRTTVENLSAYFFEVLKTSLPGLQSVRLWETADNSATCRAL